MSNYYSGTLKGGIPFLRFPGGERIAVCLPGINDAIDPMTEIPRGVEYLTAYLFPSHTVYLLGRPRNLPEGVRMANLAEATITAIKDIFSREVPLPENEKEAPPTCDLVGVSMGGMLALQICHDAPELIGHAVMEVAAARVSTQARAIGTRWEQKIKKDQWLRLRLDLLGVTFTGKWKWLAYLRAILNITRKSRKPEYPADMLRSIDACAGFDLTGELGDIKTPILLLGGEDDPLFPPELVQKTAASLPRGKCFIFPKTGHGAFLERRREAEMEILSFLEK